MLLEGSCHCGAVAFTLESEHPYPYNRCYCSVCRKTAGSGGFAINLGGKAASLKVRGQKQVRIYRVRLDRADPSGVNGEFSPLERHFCKRCGSMLWVWDPRWPELIHPFASAIDTDLPVPPERTHLMLDSRASWAVPDVNPGDKTFDAYPDESIAEWHQRLGRAG